MERVRVLGVALVCTGCAHAPPLKPPAPPPPRLPDVRARAPRPPPPAERYWQPIDPDAHTRPRKRLSLPVEESWIRKNDAVWKALSADAKEKLRTTGAVVMGSEVEPIPKNATSFGAFYTELSESGPTRTAAQLVTIDALFATTRIGLEIAL